MAVVELVAMSDSETLPAMDDGCMATMALAMLTDRPGPGGHFIEEVLAEYCAALLFSPGPPREKSHDVWSTRQASNTVLPCAIDANQFGERPHDGGNDRLPAFSDRTVETGLRRRTEIRYGVSGRCGPQQAFVAQIDASGKTVKGVDDCALVCCLIAAR